MKVLRWVSVDPTYCEKKGKRL